MALVAYSFQVALLHKVAYKLHISCIKLHIYAYPPMLSGELYLRPIKEFDWGSIVWKSMILEFHISGKRL